MQSVRRLRRERYGSRPRERSIGHGYWPTAFRQSLLLVGTLGGTPHGLVSNVMGDTDPV